MHSQKGPNLLPSIDIKAQYYAARIFHANVRLRALPFLDRAPYCTLFVNEVLTALKYLSSLEAGARVPASIIDAQDVLLRTSTSGEKGWSFSPFDIVFGSPEELFKGSLDPDLWWREEYDVAERRAKEVNVSADDLKNAYQVPSSTDLPDAPSLPLASAASPPTSDSSTHKRRQDDEDIISEDARDVDYTPRPTKRPRGRPRKSNPPPADPIGTNPRRLGDDPEKDGLPANAIVVTVDKPKNQGGVNRYHVGTTSSPRNPTPCISCHAAGTKYCFIGKKGHCTLCSLRRQTCIAMRNALGETARENLARQSSLDHDSVPNAGCGRFDVHIDGQTSEEQRKADDDRQTQSINVPPLARGQVGSSPFSVPVCITERWQ
ncbi:hypothetical protein FA95DRAFT_1285543 [Auriscalpium vulgare]|uniref:Uncharacterized protein n=1 Tax=Auriscalpium vulgare TaxID=40419 RepID=A0ACB8RTI6_9AGAM|nr:hypothetical protein FA95DRAFT_1285543 [Auriscalpium vulgare]